MWALRPVACSAGDKHLPWKRVPVRIGAFLHQIVMGPCFVNHFLQKMRTHALYQLHETLPGRSKHHPDQLQGAQSDAGRLCLWVSGQRQQRGLASIPQDRLGRGTCQVWLWSKGRSVRGESCLSKQTPVFIGSLSPRFCFLYHKIYEVHSDPLRGKLVK